MSFLAAHGCPKAEYDKEVRRRFLIRTILINGERGMEGGVHDARGG